MEEKELKQQLAFVLAENVKLRSELEALKETVYGLIEPDKLEETKATAVKTKTKIETALKNNCQVNDPELKILFLREFYPYKSEG